MYSEFFGLREAPFGPNPDPRFLWLSKTHLKGLSLLFGGIRSRNGIVLLTGDVGAGKTTLLNSCLQALPEDFLVAQVFHTSETAPVDLLALVMESFGLRDHGETKAARLIRFYEQLVSIADCGKRALVTIDEAQNLPDETLVDITLLANLRTSSSNLVQFVLIGQPELQHRLAAKALRRVRDAIRFDHHLRYLGPKETESYLRHRIDCAGGQLEQIFEPGTDHLLYELTGGCPRMLSLYAHRSLRRAEELRVTRVSVELVRTLFAVEASTPSPRRGRTRFSAAGVFNRWLHPRMS